MSYEESSLTVLLMKHRKQVCKISVPEALQHRLSKHPRTEEYFVHPTLEVEKFTDDCQHTTHGALLASECPQGPGNDF